MSFDHLLSPLTVAGKTYKHRMVASPALAGVIAPDGAFPPDQYAHYEAKAAGGCASVTIGETEVNFTYGNKAAFPPPTDYDDIGSRQFREWCRHAQMIHSHGALALVQLCQSGNLRQVSAGCVGPGYGPDEMVAADGTVIHAMTREIMDDSIASWQKAAKYMKAAGFDGVNLHFGHSWLPHQFLSPRTNHRTDEYGGCLENRMCFPLEILKGVREAVGDDFILEMRVSGSERCEGGMSLEDMATFCEKAQEFINIVHVSAGVYRDPTTNERDGGVNPNNTGMYPSMYRPNISNLHEASYIKKRVSIPVCIVGGIRSPEDAERIIAEGRVDLVAMGRQVNKADPNFANKVTANRPEDIDRCVRCGMCMGGTRPTLRERDYDEFGIDRSFKPEFTGPPTMVVPPDTDFFEFFSKPLMPGMGPDYCTVNPYHDHKEMPADKILPRTRVLKKILVIGGGMGGMQAAVTAADIGFDVVLAEKTGTLGGIFKFSDHDCHKYDLRIYKDRLINRVRNRCWIDLRLNTEVDAEFIKAEKPDFIICATGSSQSAPPIPGLKEFARPLLEAYGDNVRGKRVVMLGGGLAGCEAAAHFADSGAKSVDVVEMMDTLAPGPMDTHKIDLFRLMEKLNVGQHPATKVSRIENGLVTAESSGGTVTFEADLITYALGMRANPTDALREAAGDTPFELVGDCVQPTKVYHAIYDGVSAALRAYKLFNDR